MCKKFFRKNVYAACIAMSMIFCGTNIAGGSVVIAADKAAEDMTETVSEAVTESQMQTDESESETEAPAETEAETMLAAETEPAEPVSENVPAPALNVISAGEPSSLPATILQDEESEAQETVQTTGATVKFSANIEANADFEAAVSGASTNGYNNVTVEYVLPESVSFIEMKQKPEFGEKDVTIEYKTSDGEWEAYLDTTDNTEVYGIRVKATGEEKGCEQTKDMILVLNAFKSIDVVSKVTTTFSDDAEDSKEETTTAQLTVSEMTYFGLSMSQQPEMPKLGDQVTQTVTVRCKDDISNPVVTYKPNAGLALSKISVHPGGFLDGAKVKISHSQGTSEYDLSGDVDLSIFTEISGIVFECESAGFSDEAAFDVYFVVPDGISTFACSVSASGSAYDTDVESNYTLTTNVANCSIDKPTLYHTKEAVPFNGESALEIGGFVMNTNRADALYDFRLRTPEFVEFGDLVLPTLDGAANIEVFVTDKDGEASVGTYESGATVPIGKSGVSVIRIRITSTGNGFTTTDIGSLSFKNNDKSNKDDYFLFRSTTRVYLDDEEIMNAVKSADVFFEVYKEKETEPSSPSETPTPPQIETEKPQWETEAPQPETEDPIAAQEKANQERKKKLEALLKGRLSAIRASSLAAEEVGDTVNDAATNVIAGGRSVSTVTPKSVETQDEWRIRAIDEHIIYNPIPVPFEPIPEVIENRMLQEF